METIINDQTHDFTIHYDLGDCEAVTMGKDPLPLTLYEPIDRALKNDPLFLARYQIDFLQASQASADATNQLQAALTYSEQESSSSYAALAQLLSTDLIYYLPSLQAPLGNWDNQKPSADSQVPNAVMIAPLLKSREGEDIASDLVYLRQFLASIMRAPKPVVPNPSATLISALQGSVQAEFTRVDQVADQQVTAAVAKISPSSNTPFLFGFTVGMGPGIVPGVFFEYQGVGIDASIQPGVINVAPIMANSVLPAVPIQINAMAPEGMPSGWYIPPVGEDIVPPSVNELSAQGVDAQSIPALGSNALQMMVNNVEWSSLLSAANPTGRSWLEGEVQLAKPLLTAKELSEVLAAEKAHQFPQPLAALIASKAAEVAPGVAASASGPSAPVSAAAIEQMCAKAAWFSCGVAVKHGLDNGLTSSADVLRIALAWAAAYNRRYDELRNDGRLEKAVPESQEFEDAMKDALTPVGILKGTVTDQIEEELLRLIRSPSWVIKWALSPEIEAIRHLLSDSMATDYDELEMMNDEILQAVETHMESHLSPNWRNDLSKSVSGSPLLNSVSR